MNIKEIPVIDTGDLMLGDMGIRQIYQSDTLLYERQRSYFFIRLLNFDALEDD